MHVYNWAPITDWSSRLCQASEAVAEPSVGKFRSTRLCGLARVRSFVPPRYYRSLHQITASFDEPCVHLKVVLVHLEVWYRNNAATVPSVRPTNQMTYSSTQKRQTSHRAPSHSLSYSTERYLHLQHRGGTCMSSMMHWLLNPLRWGETLQHFFRTITNITHPLVLEACPTSTSPSIAFIVLSVRIERAMNSINGKLRWMVRLFRYRWPGKSASIVVNYHMLISVMLLLFRLTLEVSTVSLASGIVMDVNSFEIGVDKTQVASRHCVDTDRELL